MLLKAEFHMNNLGGDMKLSTIVLSLYLWLDNDGQIFVKLNFAIELINHKKRVINFVSLQLPW